MGSTAKLAQWIFAERNARPAGDEDLERGITRNHLERRAWDAFFGVEAGRDGPACRHVPHSGGRRQLRGAHYDSDSRGELK